MMSQEQIDGLKRYQEFTAMKYLENFCRWNVWGSQTPPYTPSATNRAFLMSGFSHKAWLARARYITRI